MKLKHGSRSLALRENVLEFEKWFWRVCEEVLGNVKAESTFKVMIYSVLDPKSQIRIKVSMHVTFDFDESNERIGLHEKIIDRLDNENLGLNSCWLSSVHQNNYIRSTYPFVIAYWDRSVYLDDEKNIERKAMIERLQLIWQGQALWNKLREKSVDEISLHPIKAKKQFAEAIKLLRKGKVSAFNCDREKFEKELLVYFGLPAYAEIS